MWIYVSVCSVAPCDVASISTLDFIRLGVNILPVRQRGFHLWPACSHSPDSKQKHTGPLGKVREVLASTKHLMKEGEKSFYQLHRILLPFVPSQPQSFQEPGL